MKKIKICLYCKGTFVVKTKRQQKYKFCSKRCGLTFLNKTEKHKRSAPKGNRCWNWKGNKIGYWGVHCWLRRKYGKPNFCKICKSTTEKKYVWANISGKYKRDIKDYIRLCDKCHKKYDDVLNRSWITRHKK